MLVIRHKSLRSVLSPSDMYLRDPSTSNLWDLMAYVSRVPMGPFSISIRLVGPDGLCDTLRARVPVDRSPSPSDLWDPPTHLHPTCGTRRFACHLTLAIRHKTLHSVLLHPTCGTRWLTCHVYLWDLSPSPSDLRDRWFTCHLYHVCHRGLVSQKKV
jgi:hypothetical protein